MNNELIKKAYEDFNGVWPEGWESIIVSDTKNSVWGEGKYLNWIGGRVYFFSTINTAKSNIWKWVGTKADFDACGESLKEEWTPEVGRECEYPSGRGIVKLPPDTNGILIIEEDGIYKRVAELGCRPLKTESEKQADEMFDIVKDATDTYHACELLVKNGFKKCAG